jgi:hypothetical protein
MKSPLLSASLVPLAPARAPLALGPLGPLAPAPAQAPGVRRAQQAQRAQRAQELARGWRCGLECLVQHRPMVRLQSDIRGVYL